MSALFRLEFATFTAEVAALVADGEKSRSNSELTLGSRDAVSALADGGLGLERETVAFGGAESVLEVENEPPPRRSAAAGCC